MHVARVCQEFYSKKAMKGGLALHFFDLSMELKKLGVNQTILTEHTNSNLIQGLHVHKFNSKPPFSILRSGGFAFKKIEELGEEFDLIHFHSPTYFRLLKYKKKLNTPMIQTIHGSVARVSDNIFSYHSFKARREAFYFVLASKFSFAKSDAIVIACSEEKKNLIERFKVKAEKVFVIPAGVDTKLFSPKKTEKDIDVLYTGRFTTGKRITDLLHAVKELKEEFPKIKVYLVGGKETDYAYNLVMESIQQLGLEKNVFIKNYVLQNKLVEYYNRAKVFVLPSLFEGTSKVVLEAMSCSLPVITTNICGMKDYVENGKTGFLIKPKDSNEMCKKIMLLINDEKKIKEFGKLGRKTVEKKFIWEIIAKKYMQLYKKLI